MTQIGYDNKNDKETLYFKHKLKNYKNFIEKLTNQNINIPSFINFEYTTSSDSHKYGVKFKNFFFIKVDQDNDKIFQLLKFNFEIFHCSNTNKLIQYDVFPMLKLTMKNLSEKFPFDMKIKFGNYSSKRSQYFDSTNQYDFSNVLNSMLPFSKTGIKFSHTDGYSIKIKQKDLDLSLKYTLGLNRIQDYEDNIKVSMTLKSFYNIYEELNKLFCIQIFNDFSVKKAFVFKSKYIGNEENNHDRNSKSISKNIHMNHLMSNYSCHSKILKMNLLNTGNVIDNGSDFYIQNNLTVRLKEIPILRENEILSKLNPYFEFETLFMPNWKTEADSSSLNQDTRSSRKANKTHFLNSIKFIFSIGLSIPVNESMHLNFSLYTSASKNTSIKKELINSFRFSISL